MSTFNPQLIFVDGSSYLYRAYHAMPDLSNREGQPTGAIYGVVNMLRKMQSDYPDVPVVVVFDAKGKTFRDEMYDKYKANRPPMPDDLRSQVALLYEVIRAMGLPLLSVSGVEADDVIGTLAKLAEQKKIRVLISTGDKDLAQLVSQYVVLVDTMKNQIMDKEVVKQKFAVNPDQMIDYLALVGDTSDNVPGVPKVGPKTAAKWLEKYGSLDQLIAHADEIKGKVGENLRNSLQQLQLSRELVTIKTDVSIDPDKDNEKLLQELKMAPPDYPQLQKLYQQLQFRSWLRQLQQEAQIPGAESSDQSETAQDRSQQPNNQKGEYEIITDTQHWQQWLEKLRQSSCFAFDTETTSLHYMQAEIVGISFACESGRAAYVPFIHDDIAYPQQLDRATILAQLKPLLEDPNHAKVGQNLKYDKHVLCHYQIDLQGIAYDTMLESYVLDSSATRHNLDALAHKYLNYQTIHFEDVAGKGAKQLRFDQVAVEKAAEYAAEDADIALRLHQVLWPKLQQHTRLLNLYHQTELPLLSVLGKMEATGVLIDAQLLKQQSEELHQQLQQIEQQAFEIAGETFNMASPKQIQHILFDKMQIPVTSKTPKGAPSTSESVLAELALDYPLPRLILEYRSLAKLKTTYTDKLPQLIDARTGRVHTSYNQAVAVTGRLSSTDPNLQNIPVRTAEGRRIRQAFIAEPGSLIVAADYSQIELRIMAHLSNDQGLLNAFSQGLDIHKATAAEVFSVPLDQVSKEQRRSAKAINFGLIYGMSAFGLAKQLDISRNQAQDYVDLYFSRYPGVKHYMQEMVELAKKQGYVETLFGRRLYLPEINARNGLRRKYAERTAINAPMQGSAADIIKRAMIQVDQWLEQQTGELGRVKMMMQVHDELVFEVPEVVLDSALSAIKQRMENAANLKVPLIVDTGYGSNWDQAH